MKIFILLVLQDTLQTTVYQEINPVPTAIKSNIVSVSEKTYNVISRKFVSSFDNDNYFKTKFQLPEIYHIKRKFSVSNYNPINKTVIKSEEKPLNIFISNQPIIKEKKLQSQYGKKQVNLLSDNRLSKFNVQSESEYNIYEKKEKQVFETEKIFQTIPIINRQEKNENYKFLNSYIVQRPVSQHNILYETSWATITFVIIAILLAYSKIVFGKFFGQIFKALFVSNSANRIYFEKSLILNRLLNLLSINTLLIFAAGVALFFDFFGFNFIVSSNISQVTHNQELVFIPVWQSYFLFIGLILIVISVKKLLNLIIGAMFNIQELISEYSFHSNLYIKVTGLILLLPIMSIPYISDNNVLIVFRVLIFIILAGYFLRIFRLFLLTIKKGLSYLYLFLYFCALEFGPFLVLFFSTKMER